MIPVAGSVYSYSYSTIGEGFAWFIGWVLILEYLFACSSVSVGWSGYFLNFMDSIGVAIPKALSYATFDHTEEGWKFTGSLFNLPAVGVVVLMSSFLMGGVKQSAWVNNIIVVVKLSVILLFIGFGLAYVIPENWTPYIPDNTGQFGDFGWSGILRGAAVVFYAYLGFDALSATAQEVKILKKICLGEY